jgi:hypothetical protein
VGAVVMRKALPFSIYVWMYVPASFIIPYIGILASSPPRH